jgi:hypothetical protein
MLAPRIAHRFLFFSFLFFSPAPYFSLFLFLFTFLCLSFLPFLLFFSSSFLFFFYFFLFEWKGKHPGPTNLHRQHGMVDGFLLGQALLTQDFDHVSTGRGIGLVSLLHHVLGEAARDVRSVLLVLAGKGI